MTDFVGETLGKYVLQQRISRSGVADVYRARCVDSDAAPDVAVKVFRANFARHVAFREYFMQATEKVSRFRHPNILPLLEYGVDEDVLYVVHPFVSTGTLETLLKRVGGRFSALQVLPIVEQLCAALQYVHGQQVIHGNVKPGNVFVSADGRMLLTDFSVVRGYDDSQESLTQVGWGSAEYAAPEQSLGVLRFSSDIYSLGVLLFSLLAGTPPFSGQTPVEVLLKHVRQAPPSLRSYVPTISDAVDSVVQKALQKRSDDRFACVDDLRQAFLAAVAVAPVASPVARSMTGKLAQPLSDRSPALKLPITPPPVVLSPAADLPAKGSRPASMAPPPLSPVHSFPVSEPSSSMAGSPVTWQAQGRDGPLATQAPRTDLPLTDVTERHKRNFLREERLEITEVRKRNLLHEDNAADVTEVRKRNFLYEDNDRGPQLFRSADPAEWSPIAEARGDAEPAALALTANEYLQQKSLVPPIEEKVAQEEQETNRKEDMLNDRLQKLLPLLVIFLLLLGLLAALSTALLFK